MKKKELISLALMVILFISCSKKEIKIAIVGDSITEGYGLSNKSKNAYPVMLDSILGSNYAVLNCGRSSTKVQKTGMYLIGIVVNFITYLLLNLILLV